MGTKENWEKEMPCPQASCQYLSNTGKRYIVGPLDWQNQARLMLQDDFLKNFFSDSEVPEKERREDWDQLFPN